MKRNSSALYLVALAILGAHHFAAAQTTITVPSDQPTIQAGINVAVNGDTVLVSPGTYSEQIDLLGKEITLVSVGGPASTAIDGSGAGSVITADSGETANTVIEGFTIQNGGGFSGSGINILLGSPTIRGNVFDSNVSEIGGSGAAILGNNASPLIEDNLFTNNTCDSQFTSGVISFVNSSSAVIVNNVFLNNPCRGVNIVSPGGQSHEVSNNTFVGNDGAITVSIAVDASGQLVRNNIMFQNTVGYDMANQEPPFLNNLVFDNATDYVGVANQTGLNGNIADSPLFVNLPGGNVHIDALSPARNAGNSAAAALPAFDFDGDNRVIGGTVDIGADEFDPTPPMPISMTYSLFALTAVVLLTGAYFIKKFAATT